MNSNVNEVIKTILDFFIQKNSFLNSPKKLAFVRTLLYSKKYLLRRSQETSFCSYIKKYYCWCSGTTIPLLFAYSILWFCLVPSLCFWCLWCVQNFFVKKKFKTALTTSFTLLLLWGLNQVSYFENRDLSE